MLPWLLRLKQLGVNDAYFEPDKTVMMTRNHLALRHLSSGTWKHPGIITPYVCFCVYENKYNLTRKRWPRFGEIHVEWCMFVCEIIGLVVQRTALFDDVICSEQKYASVKNVF